MSVPASSGTDTIGKVAESASRRGVTGTPGQHVASVTSGTALPPVPSPVTIIREADLFDRVWHLKGCHMAVRVVASPASGSAKGTEGSREPLRDVNGDPVFSFSLPLLSRVWPKAEASFLFFLSPFGVLDRNLKTVSSFSLLLAVPYRA
jgi:hypothetical protein